MLKCVLSRISCLQIDTTISRLCSSQSFKDKWPRKILEIERNNPVRLKRRPILFAKLNYQTQNERSDFNERAGYKRNRYIQHYSENDGDTEADYYGNINEGRHNRATRTAFNNDFVEPKHRYARPQIQRDMYRPLHKQMLDDMYISEESKDEDLLFGGYSKKSKDRLRELMGGDKKKEYAEETEDNFIRLSHEGRGPNSRHTYESKIERFCKQGRLEEAEKYFNKLIDEYRFKPTAFMYGNLVKAHAKEGNLKKCFSLYNQMKKRGLEPSGSHIYTSLFEVCLNFSSDKQLALAEATQLLGRIRYSNVQMSAVTYNAAVKCFGMLGDVETAFRLADECPSTAANDSYMLSSLLIACSSHKHSGFQLAISVWRSLRKKKHLYLTTKQYNLLLRTLYCGSGDMDQFRQLVQYQQPKQAAQTDQSPLQIAAAADSTESITSAIADSEEEGQVTLSGIQLVSNESAASSVQATAADAMPDILNSKLKLPAEMTLKSLHTASDRLMALGGVTGILNRMKTHNCKPDIVTFFYLLRALPNNKQCEEGLLQVMQEYEVVPDSNFYRYIFIRMLKRNCCNEVYDFYRKTREDNVQYDRETYRILAEVCTTLYKCQQLLDDMTEQGIAADLPMLKAMLLNAGCTHFEHLEMILEEMDKCSITPDKEFLDILDHKFNTGKSRLVAQEKNPKSHPRMVIDKAAMQNYDKFYSIWLERQRDVTISS